MHNTGIPRYFLSKSDNLKLDNISGTTITEFKSFSIFLLATKEIP